MTFGPAVLPLWQFMQVLRGMKPSWLVAVKSSSMSWEWHCVQAAMSCPVVPPLCR